MVGLMLISCHLYLFIAKGSALAQNILGASWIVTGLAIWPAWSKEHKANLNAAGPEAKRKTGRRAKRGGSRGLFGKR